MAENTKKIAEISVILGISEQACREIAKEYDEILPCKRIGKIGIYEDNTVDRFRKIADLQAQGLPKEVIIPAIRGGKSLMERAMEDMKKMGMDVSNEKEKHVPKPAPRSETEEELILAVRSAESSVATMEHRICALRERSEADTALILDAVSSVSAEVAELKIQVHTLWDQIATLETYLRESQKGPFWKR
ncbi:MAG TPA: hypothetical protein O0W87_03875 [Methanocorpusculum sp.]|nr:hypothetical protein [Methanocorpusculum sp.]HJJ50736.1 hypothetical protein [Methanocorpusculum sp.]